jgi:hypothetical protein
MKTVFTRDRFGRVSAVAIGALAATESFAAVDVSGAVTAVDGAIPAVTSLGTAVLGVLVVAAVFKWVRKVF